MITKVCYLLCFAQPIGNPDDPIGQAGHYLGSSTNLVAELARFRRNGGHAKIMQELHRQGIGFELVRTWPGGRGVERRLKGMNEQRRRGQGLRRYCPRCGASTPQWWMKGDTMIGGYSLVAGVLNRTFRPEPPIDRRQVAAWYQRGTYNRDGVESPRETEKRTQAKRTTPRLLFDTDAWVAWFRPGVPGPRNKGWRIYDEVPADEQDTAPEPAKRAGRPRDILQPAGN